MRGACVVTDEARSDSCCRLNNVVCRHLCVFAFQDDGHAWGLPAKDVPRTADRCVWSQTMDVVSLKYAFHEVSVFHHPAGATDIVGDCEVDEGHERSDAPKRSVASKGDVPRRSFAVDVRGSPVSLRGLLQN